MPNFYTRTPLHTRILTGLAVGVIAGLLVKLTVTDEGTLARIADWVSPIGKIFLNFIFMMIIPLILTALTMAIAEMEDVRKLGRMGLRLLRYTLITTSISVMIGLVMVSISKPGENLSPENREAIVSQYRTEAAQISEAANSSEKKSFGDILVSIVPKNPIEDMARAFDPAYRGGGLLSVLFFACILGIAISVVDQNKVRGLKDTLAGLYEVVMKVIDWAMQLAPFGIAALIFVLTLKLGLPVLLILLQYVGIVLVALAIHFFGTYSIVLKYFSGMSPGFFFRGMRDVIITAFSTSSSNATLPVTIRDTVEKLHVKPEVAHFVLTVGSTGNQHGTALYEGITILFLAQVFGVDLTIVEQGIVLLTAILAGIGTAGVPGGSLPVIMLILVSLNIPGESIALIYGVDRILDMSRTVLNVTGDVAAAVYIDSLERKDVERTKLS